MDLLDAVAERAAARLRELEPLAIAVLATGSYARGTADEFSDLDLRALTEGGPRLSYRTWFDERTDGVLVHVSVASKEVDAWLASAAEPHRWALGFPVRYDARYVWTSEEARARLGADPSRLHPPSPPELEDFVEFLAKTRRSIAADDPTGVRLHAREVGRGAPGLLRPLNDTLVVHDRREALEAALSLTVAPEHYRQDLAVCLGVVAASDEEVASAALRLGRELLAFLRERKPDVDAQPDLARHLADGTLERHLGFGVE